MGTARNQVVALLAGVLPADITVLPYARQIDPPSRPTVMVRVDEVRPSPHANGFRDYGFALVLVSHLTAAGPADDELDGLLEDVLYALEQDAIPNGVVVGTATRATYAETSPAYEVALTVTITKEQ